MNLRHRSQNIDYHKRKTPLIISVSVSAQKSESISAF